MLVVADRLKLPIQKVLEMPIYHFNLWIAYLKKEQDEYKTQKNLAQANKYR
jgi:hypothetical protein|tara:strand:- start:2719 stop:2871 length:153 start_codon:yes stop_codon:yes gene_type:complete